MLIGVEEEVFICEPKTPHLSSLYYLTKLLLREPGFYYTHTASNFARGRDLSQGIMSGVEVATSVHSSAQGAFEELMELRRELSLVSEGLIVPLGHLIQTATPTNTCALQVHVGGFSDWRKVYGNLAHFLPVLAVMGLNAPYAEAEYGGYSYRLAYSYAIGPLVRDHQYRFQDLILSKRLGTIEVRVFDPFWDPDRLLWVLKVIEAIAGADHTFQPDRSFYNERRQRIAKEGWLPELEPLWDELNQLISMPRELVARPPALETKDLYEAEGLLRCYSALDHAYREGVLESRPLPPPKSHAVRYLQGLAGLTGYYLPKLPYILWKYLREK